MWSACLLCGLMLCGLVRWSYAIVYSVCAAASSVKMGFYVCGSGGGSSCARRYLQVRRANRGSRR